jgi:ferredoxin
MVKATVDAEACVGCGACVDICPDVFKMEGDKAVSFIKEIPAEAVKCAQEAKDTCPVDAIVVS